MMSNIEKIYKILKDNNYKLTNQREKIINVILKHEEKHLNSEEIYDYVKKEDKSIGLATVYRTIKLFVNLDILTELNLGDESVRYDLNLDFDIHNHHHLICNSCGKVIEVKDDSLEILEKKIENEYNFQISNHKCKFLGLCKECKE